MGIISNTYFSLTKPTDLIKNKIKIKEANK